MSLRSSHRVIISVAAAGCRTAPAPEPNGEHVNAKVVPIVTVKELMKGIVDPELGCAVGCGRDRGRAEGTVEKAPKTDEDWAKVEYALVLAEVPPTC